MTKMIIEDNVAKIALDLQSLSLTSHAGARQRLISGIVELLAANRILRGEAR